MITEEFKSSIQEKIERIKAELPKGVKVLVYDSDRIDGYRLKLCILLAMKGTLDEHAVQMVMGWKI